MGDYFETFITEIQCDECGPEDMYNDNLDEFYPDENEYR